MAAVAIITVLSLIGFISLWCYGARQARRMNFDEHIIYIRGHLAKDQPDIGRYIFLLGEFDRIRDCEHCDEARLHDTWAEFRKVYADYLIDN